METMNVYVAWLENNSAFQALDLLFLSSDMDRAGTTPFIMSTV